MMNAFIKQNEMGAGTALTENGALSYATAGTTLIDQFAHAGTARGRDIATVWQEQGQLWAENPEMALKFPFYLRMITRQTNIGNGKKTEKVQRGQGARDEAFKRLLWIAKYHSDEFYRNLWLVPVVGSWKDLWVLLSMDDTLNKEQFFRVIAEGINDENSRDLVKKYLPRIRSDKKCTSDWAKKTNALAKEFAHVVGWTYQDYRTFKSTGKAHEFQRMICSGQFKDIKWNTIPGKALLNLVSGKFLHTHGLEDSYMEWLKKQPVAKFNGYAYELGMKIGNRYCMNLPAVQKITIDKQFDGLIETAKKDDGGIKGNVLCALDTSGSMGCMINGGPAGLTSYDVCVSLGIYFSELNTGAFHNHVAMFDSVSRMLELKGSFSDKWFQIRNASTAWGSTNVQSIVNMVIRTRMQHPEIPIEDYPWTWLIVSDMQFNPCGSESNYEAIQRKLRTVFPDEVVDKLKIVWWYCAGREAASKDVPATMDMPGMYLVSGFDGSILQLLLGTKVDEKTGKAVSMTMEESVNAALTQEVLTLVQ